MSRFLEEQHIWVGGRVGVCLKLPPLWWRDESLHFAAASFFGPGWMVDVRCLELPPFWWRDESLFKSNKRFFGPNLY